MPRCLMIYYSQSGTTQKVAEHICKGLKSTGYQVDLCNLETEKAPDTTQYDLLGIGSPVYFFNPVSDIKRYINRLPQLNGMPAFVFGAYGTDYGKAPEKLAQLLATKGAKNAGSCYCRNANFIIGYIKAGEVLGLDHIKPEELNKAETFGSAIGNIFA
ncbi:MAG: flavodoxin family protein [Syntrophomonadaceae bacterium]|nr:flavodoxin family protein [Syntrophomonadaceae bacterium]MDD4550309.1 flavodoxin family protein [Syntrophomonadaceae bacterium]